MKDRVGGGRAVQPEFEFADPLEPRVMPQDAGAFFSVNHLAKRRYGHGDCMQEEIHSLGHRPTRLVFMLAVDSGAGQQVVPSPGSLARQRGRTSRVL